MQSFRPAVVPLLLVLSCLCEPAAKAKTHIVTLGPSRRVPYTPPEATVDTKSEDATTLRIRPLLVDGLQKEWTVGDAHDVTDRTFVIRRALHINDSLPAEAVRWNWQPGPWLMVDRQSGHVTALHLPDFDPQVSQVVWFRDYAAYCGTTTTGKGSLIAVVAELGARKAVVQKALGQWPQASPVYPTCVAAAWQRTPMRVTLQASGGQPMTFDVVGTGSLIEENDNDSDN